MATLTIRDVPEDVKQALRVKAAESGRSLEEALRSEQAGDPDQPVSRIDANETMRRAAELEQQPLKGEWRLKASKEGILALGQKPERPFDQKQVSDELYVYLEE